MYNRHFFSTRLGKVSALCIAAMVGLNVITITAQVSASTPQTLVHAALVVVI